MHEKENFYFEPDVLKYTGGDNTAWGLAMHLVKFEYRRGMLRNNAHSSAIIEMVSKQRSIVCEITDGLTFSIWKLKWVNNFCIMFVSLIN